MATDSDVQYVRETVANWLGTRSWTATADSNGSLTINFGNALRNERGYVRGEWRLWASFCEWRIEQDGSVVAGRNDSEARINTAMQRLNGLVLRRVELTVPALDAVLYFDGGLVLRLFCVTSEEYESWYLFMPDHRVLIVGPGERWILQSSQEPYPSYL